MPQPDPAQRERRWTIKPELLVSPLTGAEISMGIAYGPAVDEALDVVPAAALAEIQASRDELRDDAEMQVAVMREAALRLRPLARRALTEGGESGDKARRDLHEAIAWIAKGCPKVESDVCIRCSGAGRDDGGPCGRCGGDGTEV